MDAANSWLIHSNPVLFPKSIFRMGLFNSISASSAIISFETPAYTFSKTFWKCIFRNHLKKEKFTISFKDRFTIAVCFVNVYIFLGILFYKKFKTIKIYLWSLEHIYCKVLALIVVQGPFSLYFSRKYSYQFLIHLTIFTEPKYFKIKSMLTLIFYHSSSSIFKTTHHSLLLIKSLTPLPWQPRSPALPSTWQVGFSS